MAMKPLGRMTPDPPIGDTPPERIASIMTRTPTGRFGEAEELIGATVFLASRLGGVVRRRNHPARGRRVPVDDHLRRGRAIPRHKLLKFSVRRPKVNPFAIWTPAGGLFLGRV